MQYLDFHIIFKGKEIRHNNRIIQRHHVYALILMGRVTVDNILKRERDWNYYDKAGWQQGKLIKKSL